jgi:hypothetical protein
MAQVRDVLGHVVVEEAQRRRVCHRKRKAHAIEKGQSCLVISDENGGSKNYCVVCASEILKKARASLASFASGLGVDLEPLVPNGTQS